MKLWILGFILFISACTETRTQWIEVHGDNNEATIKFGIGLQPRWAIQVQPHIALPPPVDLWLKKDN